MSLERIEGFDHANGASLITKYDSTSVGSVASSTGRFSGNAGDFFATDSLILTSSQLAQKATRVVGFAAKFSAATATEPFFQFRDGTTSQCELAMNSTRNFVVRRNTTTLSTSSYIFPLNTWMYIEFKATINNSGSFEVRVNGTNILSGSSIDTQETANAYSDGIRLLASNNFTFSCDDFYLLNSDGSAPHNDFLGECRVETNTASGDGTTVQWTPLSSTNASNVDDGTTPDSDTTYNSETTVGEIDLYAITNFSFSGTVYGTQTNLFVRKDDAGSSAIRELCRSGGTNFEGSDYTPGSSYAYALQLRTVDPNTSAAWDLTGINNAEFGIKLQS